MSADSPPPPPPSPPSVAGDVGTFWGHLRVLGWTALFLIVLELALEWRAYGRGWDTWVFGHEAPERPSAASAAPASGPSAYGPTDAFPFRSRIVPAARTAGVPRLWIASASYAMGGNLAEEYVFPVRIGDLLRDAGTPTEVLNAGRVGRSVLDNTAELRASAATWKPDVAVLYQMSTDVDQLSRTLGQKGGLEAAAGSEGLSWGAAVITRTTVWPLLKEEISSRVTRMMPLDDGLGAEGERAFEARVRGFTAACRELGIQPVLCTFATSHGRDDPDPLPNHVFRYNQRLSRKGWHDTVDAWNDLLRRVAKDEGLLLVDLAPLLLGRRASFVDFVHFSKAGHETVARAVVEALRGPANPRPLGGEGPR